jgi:RNA polymerase sigma-70 factor (ECF subfamily)
MVTDEALYQQVRRGDLGAFDDLYARYERRLFGFTLRMLGDRAEAEEVLHDAFLNVLKAEQAQFLEARFSSWLFRIARNLCANRLRSRRRGRGALSLVGAAPNPPEPTPEELLTKEERTQVLAEAVQRLPPALADVFHLRTSGLSYEEMAGVLGIPLGTVKSRMNALVQQLKGNIEP